MSPENKSEKRGIFQTFILEGEKYIAALCCFVLIGLLMVQVISRYVFKFSITWVEEFSVILFAWLAYSSMSAGAVKRKHIRIDVLLKHLPYGLRKFAYIFDNLFSCALCAVMSYGMIRIMKGFTETNYPKTLLMGMPMMLIYGICLAFLILFCIRTLQDVVKLFHEQGDDIGASKGTLDIESMEREYLESQQRKNEEKEAKS